MAKADVVLPNGTKVSVEGTAEEVRQVIDALGRRAKKHADRKSAPARQTKKGGAGPTDRVRSLKEQEFFAQKRSLPDVLGRLGELGHIYKQEDLSTVLVRMTRAGELRRLQEDGAWVYVNP